jgi:prolyl-tRNA synthetase
VPIWRKDAEKSAVAEFVAKVKDAVGDRVRLKVDDRDQYSPGWKYNEYEMRGVPVRLEVGPRDVTQGSVMSVRRDTRAKEPIALAALAERLPALLDQIQKDLFDSARRFRDENTTPVESIDDIAAHFETKRGFVALPWDDDAALEARIKERTGATLRCVPLDQTPFAGRAGDGRPVALFARSY